jgi:hypothetical protein
MIIIIICIYLLAIEPQLAERWAVGLEEFCNVVRHLCVCVCVCVCCASIVVCVSCVSCMRVVCFVSACSVCL